MLTKMKIAQRGEGEGRGEAEGLGGKHEEKLRVLVPMDCGVPPTARLMQS